MDVEQHHKSGISYRETDDSVQFITLTPNDNVPVYPISIAAQLLNISIPTLRLYEKEGLIIPYKKSSNQRLYSQNDIKRLSCIRMAINEKKISIAGIKMMFSMIPCWKIKGCSKRDREHCEAYHNSAKPCWSYKHKENSCENVQCRACHVYIKYSDCNSIKQGIIESTR